MSLTVRDLLADPPVVHGHGADGRAVVTFGLIQPALEWIERTVKPGDRTLETGSGLSTITFALCGAEHTCVVPDPAEPERLRAYCEERGIDHSRVTFEVAPSERVLPYRDWGELDLVLIDGSHSFPHVFIDWFYTQEALKVGGVVIVDDVHVWTGRVLRDFLRAEPGWELVERWQARTVAFRKTAEVDTGPDWPQQPYVWRKTSRDRIGRVRLAAGLLREGDLREFAARVRGAVRRG